MKINHYTKQFFLLLFVFLPPLLYAQYYSWAKPFLGGGDDRGMSVAVGASGNVYTVGYFEGTVDFDPGPGVNSIMANGSPNAFISKLDAMGNHVWTRILNGTTGIHAYSVVLDDSENVYITGEFEGTIDLDPGPGTSSFTAGGTYGTFICKLNSSGNFVWGKTLGGTGSAFGQSIDLDASGNVYIAGYFNGTVDADPGPGVSNLTFSGWNDVFVIKLDASGNFVWGKSMGGSGDDRGVSVKVSSSGNVYTTGWFNGTADFDPSAGVSNLVSSGYSDGFVCKLNASGDLVWAKKLGGTYPVFARSIAIDASENVYTTGSFYATIDLNPNAGTNAFTSNGESDIYISKLDASGNYVWGTGLGSISYDEAYSIFVDDNGLVYTTGEYRQTVDFDPGAGTDFLTSAGMQDVYICKYSAGGSLLWAGSVGGPYADSGEDIFVNSEGNMYLTGIFQGSADFDPGSGSATVTSHAGTNIDVFVLKLSTCENATASLSGTTISSNITGTSYQWVDCNNGNANISGATSQSYTPTSNGSYAVVVNNGSCSSTSNCVTVSTITTGLEENSLIYDLILYPNPTNGNVEITSTMNISKIEVYDLQGKQFEQKHSGMNSIDLSGCNSGIYIVRIIDDKGNVVNKRIVKID